MTIQEAISSATQQMHEIEDNQKIIYSLLASVLCLPEEYLWAHPDKLITQEQHKQFQLLINRAGHHEPLAYLLGYADFYDLRFKVTPDTLIPRPETEGIVDKVLQWTNIERPKNSPLVIVDVGTGSGCIAITLAKHLPASNVYAIDISPTALEIARSNANACQVSNVTLLSGSFLGPLEGLLEPGNVDVIVANLPYISDAEYERLPLNVKCFEPELALRSGADPDFLNRELISQSTRWLKQAGLFLHETTNGQIVNVTPKNIA